MKIRRKISIILICLTAAISSFFYVFNRMSYSHGRAEKAVEFEVSKGENALDIGEKLQQEDIISNRIYFLLYLWKQGKLHSMIAGNYELSPKLTIPEIAEIITNGNVKDGRIQVTFPEGLTAVQMADILYANGLDGDGFLALVKDPSWEIVGQFDFLQNRPQKSLEGFLFPDTYFFAKDVSAQEIVIKILNNFDAKLTDNMRRDIADEHKTIFEVITMASIIEKEAKYPRDMALVSSVFWNRIAIGQRLQSDATLEYVLGSNDIKHSVEQTKMQSPYNTYQVEGLPPGPVSNPGINAISASINPVQSDYMYFLTDLKTGSTIFSKTFDEHVANKQKFGL